MRLKLNKITYLFASTVGTAIPCTQQVHNTHVPFACCHTHGTNQYIFARGSMHYDVGALFRAGGVLDVT